MTWVFRVYFIGYRLRKNRFFVCQIFASREFVLADKPLKVSVVITCFNLEAYIGDCVNSVLLQGRAADEIILADDASTDGSVNAALGLAPDIRVVRRDVNSGALQNTLAGLTYATGDIVAFIDGDDTWPPNKLARVVEEFSGNSDVILVTHGHRRVDDLGFPTGKTDETHANIDRIFAEANEDCRQMLLRRSAILREGLWFGSAYCIRRSALDLDRFSLLLMNSEESKFSYLDLVLAPYLVKANPNGLVCYMPDVIFDYRVHSNNSAASNTLEKQLKALIRVRATNTLTLKVLNSLGEDVEVTEKYGLILLEYDFLESLYRRQYVTALRLFINLSPFFCAEKNLIRS